jgi:hypothetical protein
MSIIHHSIVQEQTQRFSDDEYGVWSHATYMAPGGYDTDPSHGLYQGTYGQVLRYLKLNKQFESDDYLAKVPIHKVDT